MSDTLGGLSETKDADEGTQQLCNQVKQKVEDQTKKTYEEFRAVKYRDQIVNGKNFFIKVHVGGGDYLHLRVLQGLASEKQVELRGVLTDMGKEDPITYF